MIWSRFRYQKKCLNLPMVRSNLGATVIGFFKRICVLNEDRIAEFKSHLSAFSQVLPIKVKKQKIHRCASTRQ